MYESVAEIKENFDLRGEEFLMGRERMTFEELNGFARKEAAAALERCCGRPGVGGGDVRRAAVRATRPTRAGEHCAEASLGRDGLARGVLRTTRASAIAMR